jgi:hypothetical protein
MIAARSFQSWPVKEPAVSGGSMLLERKGAAVNETKAYVPYKGS